MKTVVSIVFFFLAGLSIASETFTIGDETFSLAFEKNDYPNSAKAFIAEDVERVFTPLGNITNIADISVFSTNAEE